MVVIQFLGFLDGIYNEWGLIKDVCFLFGRKLQWLNASNHKDWLNLTGPHPLAPSTASMKCSIVWFANGGYEDAIYIRP